MFLHINFNIFIIGEGKYFADKNINICEVNEMETPYGLTVRGVILNENDELLILKRHPKSRTDPEMWELPGGKVEKGEFFTDALLREIKEETNLNSNIGDFFGKQNDQYYQARACQIIPTYF